MKKQFSRALMSIALGIAIFTSSCVKKENKFEAHLMYLKEHPIKYKEFVARMEGNKSEISENENCTTCETVGYCPISTEELLTNMRNYRENIWKLNSKFYSGRSTTNYDVNLDKLDARFMEMNVSDLENYICNVKKMAKHQNDAVRSIRFYFIQYPGSVGDNSNPHAGCHSLALVPVFQQSGFDYIKEGAIFDIGGCQDQQDKSEGSIENHNQICPPMTGCDLSKTLIQQLDTH